MAIQYADLTGAQIVGKVRKRNRGIIVKSALLIVLLLAFLVGVIWMIRESGRYLLGIFGIFIIAVLMYVLLQSIGNASNVLKDVEAAPVFRKFGAPETIAARIANGSGNPLLATRRTLIGDGFIMKQGDCESYSPFESVRLMYRKEHRTNGIKDSIFLVVYDEYGNSVEYPFQLGRKHADEMRTAVDEIVRQSTDCRVGYTRENIEWIRSVAKKL